VCRICSDDLTPEQFASGEAMRLGCECKVGLSACHSPGCQIGLYMDHTGCHVINWCFLLQSNASDECQPWCEGALERAHMACAMKWFKFRGVATCEAGTTARYTYTHFEWSCHHSSTAVVPSTTLYVYSALQTDARTNHQPRINTNKGRAHLGKTKKRQIKREWKPLVRRCATPTRGWTSASSRRRPPRPRAGGGGAGGARRGERGGRGGAGGRRRRTAPAAVKVVRVRMTAAAGTATRGGSHPPKTASHRTTTTTTRTMPTRIRGGPAQPQAAGWPVAGRGCTSRVQFTVPELESAWFQPLRLRSVEKLVSKICALAQRASLCRYSWVFWTSPILPPSSAHAYVYDPESGRQVRR
jgi:hypothetical protein